MRRDDPRRRLEEMVLRVHRRNGGELTALDLDWPLQAPELGLDSMDLAEVMVAVEREFGLDPFNAAAPPRTWRELLASVEAPSAE